MPGEGRGRPGADHLARATVKRNTARCGHRVLQVALLWVVLVLTCVFLGLHVLAPDARIRWEEDVRAEVREDMAGYALQDPAAWEEHRRRVDGRIAALRKERSLTRVMFYVVTLLGVGATAWLFWPEPERRTAAGGAAAG